MKKFQLFGLICFFIGGDLLAQGWKPAGERILTPWAEKIDVKNVLSEYPRPQLIRGNWQNLNGLWQYAITEESVQAIPSNFDGQILVPFAVESALSGVGKTVGKDNVLWYKNTFDLKRPSGTDQLLLNFGAVDWRCDVFVNGAKVASHEGGFDPFSFNITNYLKKGNKQDIVLRVWDPTDEGPQPRGKQIKSPHGIWYTPVTGIWQTVWTEVVPATYIISTKHTPDIDNGQIKVSVNIGGAVTGDVVKIVAYDGENIIDEATVPSGVGADLEMKNAKLWSPSSPYLYRLKIYLMRGTKQIDYVESYFAMRKISLKKDANGIERLALNNEFLFQYGPLDQGWWPDGLYTAPSDEALAFDVAKTKQMGFNMIRKHIKVEPARWYKHCDSLGILVWQDMPSGDLGANQWDMRPGQISGKNLDKIRSSESENYFRKEWRTIMDVLHNFPSIVVWVPFNEAWGQFKTKEITEFTMNYDPSRLVNSASGGNFFYTGHILDIHNYPDPAMPDPAVFGKGGQALVLGEFGGLGLPVENHTWQQKDNWGYQSFKNNEELLQRYQKLMTDLKRLIPMGLSAGVYTQTTDVEVETNGIMTYDRKVIKIPENTLNALHNELYRITVK
ncbi:MAG: beta-galactosidase [Sphingobacteriales bacterium 41-5]|nr:MAG: beta-galactosidase [Sphingobacteriales bacterium 41-5]